MEHLELAAIYSVAHGEDDLPLLARLGFQHRRDLSLSEGPVATCRTLVLDFGTGVLDWLGRLIDAQCAEEAESVGLVPALDPNTSNSTGRSAPTPFLLDRHTRELVVDGDRRSLTRLEYGVLDHLFRHVGVVASRDDLLESVWGQRHTGSNVVDVVIRALRKKLGPYAAHLQTVTGFGYKLLPPRGRS